MFSFTYGKYLIKRNQILLLLSSGLASNNEKYFANDDGSNDPDVVDLESIFKLEFRSFSNNEPEFNIHPYVIIYPSLTDWARIRSDFNIYLMFEVLHDLFFTLTYYNQLDNRPPGGGKTSDYGVVTSFSFTF